MTFYRGRAIQLWVLAILLLWPYRAPALELGLSSDTIVRQLERDDRDGRSRSLLPAYEFMRFDYGNLRTPGLSFHAYGWGRVNLRDDYANNTTAGELLYAYLEYLDPNRDWQLRLGRQYIFEGVTRESLDGAYVKTDIVPTVTLSAYAGFPVNLEDTGGVRGDSMVGVRVAHSLPGRYDVGLSYKRTANNGSVDEQLLGTDVSLLLPWNVSVFGHSTLNLITAGWGEHSYEVRIPISSFEIRPFFQKYRYADFLSRNPGSANPFRVLSRFGDRVTVAGSEAFWYPAENIEFGGRYKHYEYDSRYGKADMYTALATVRRKIFSEVGVEFGRVEGDIPENRYYLGRAYVYWDIAPFFVTGDVMYVDYDEDIYRKGSAFFASAGAGGRFLEKALNVKLALDYSNDPYFDKDYRGIISASYSFAK
ncbi:hypothetical protein [Geobacter sp.]|uniref:hypothetical protein n=1 Tax=Geobacter sp. TaxID=46610 RepID=UPI00261B12BE|nr:hypothetical protein [Geobacter sp.]